MSARDLDYGLIREKANSFIKVIDNVLAGNFPTDDTVHALKAIRARAEYQILDIKDAYPDASQELFQQFCKEINSTIFEYLPFVGLLLRSGNIRNSFESYLPLRDLATKLIGTEVKLVICSEWDFSPFIHPLPRDVLSEYTIIGFPASETDNPLILPLAGHELGHAIWRRTPLGPSQIRPIQNAVAAEVRRNWSEFQTTYKIRLDESSIESDLEVVGIWRNSFDYAYRQIEELFCDTVGIYLFGHSYLQAFRYLLAPAVTDIRKNFSYPPMADRVAFNATAFQKIYGQDAEWFKACFYGHVPGDQKQLSIVVRISDEVTRNYQDSIVQTAITYMTNLSMSPFDSAASQKVYDHFKEACPIQHDASIATILGAAWKLRENIQEMKISTDEAGKLKILSNLVLKSFEVWELRHRTAAAK